MWNKVLAFRSGLPTIPTVPSDKRTQELRHLDILLSQVAMDMWYPHVVFGKTSHFPPAEPVLLHGGLSCWNYPARPLPSSRRAHGPRRHEGGRPRASLFQQLCGSLGPCSLPASYTSPPPTCHCGVYLTYPSIDPLSLCWPAVVSAGCHRSPWLPPPCFSRRHVNSSAGGPWSCRRPAPPSAGSEAEAQRGTFHSPRHSPDGSFSALAA